MKKKAKRKVTVSEFGKGLTYCIGLFLCHAENEIRRLPKEMRAKTIAQTWFNGASDHLYDLDTSTIKDKKLKADIDDWQDAVLHWGHGFSKPYADEVDMQWAIDKAKEFLRRIDKLNGVETIKGKE